MSAVTNINPYRFVARCQGKTLKLCFTWWFLWWYPVFFLSHFVHFVPICSLFSMRFACIYCTSHLKRKERERDVAETSNARLFLFILFGCICNLYWLLFFIYFGVRLRELTFGFVNVSTVHSWCNAFDALHSEDSNIKYSSLHFSPCVLYIGYLFFHIMLHKNIDCLNFSGKFRISKHYENTMNHEVFDELNHAWKQEQMFHIWFLS